MNDSDTDSDVKAVLTLYLGLPGTPWRATSQDRRLASQLHEHRGALSVVASAFLLASIRRLARPADVPALSPIRSWPTSNRLSNELLSNPAPANYTNIFASNCTNSPNAIWISRKSLILVPEAGIRGSKNYVFKMIANKRMAPQVGFEPTNLRLTAS